MWERGGVSLFGPAAGISGEVLYVDGGYRRVGMSFPSDSDSA